MKRRLLHEIYLFGHSGRALPSWMRRMVARSEWHRAWLLGFTGCFAEGEVQYGPANPYGRMVEAVAKVSYAGRNSRS